MSKISCVENLFFILISECKGTDFFSTAERFLFACSGGCSAYAKLFRSVFSFALFALLYELKNRFITFFLLKDSLASGLSENTYSGNVPLTNIQLLYKVVFDGSFSIFKSDK